jgi:hypothetical protein
MAIPSPGNGWKEGRDQIQNIKEWAAQDQEMVGKKKPVNVRKEWLVQVLVKVSIERPSPGKKDKEKWKNKSS